MRGTNVRQDGLFSDVSLDARVPKAHPLRAVRDMVDRPLAGMSWKFEAVYAAEGRPSIAPERLLRALLQQVFYSIRSERLLCEQLDYNLLFRWFVGLSGDEPVWNHSMFLKNRDRLLEADIARITRHSGYAINQRTRKRIEECSGWSTGTGPIDKTKFRGVTRVDFQFVLTMAAYNLFRLRGLLAPAST